MSDSNQGKTHGSQFSKHTILCLDRPFSPVEVSGRVCAEWSGVLRGATNYRHLLRVEHLRPMSLFVEGLETIDAPFRTDESLTHQFWCWYQRRVMSKSAPPLELLFRFQLDLGSELIQIARSLPSKTPLQQRGRTYALEQTYGKIDRCAAHIAGAIAARMQGLHEHHKPSQFPNLALRRVTLEEEGDKSLGTSDDAWLLVIEKAFLTCYVSRKRLSEDSVSGIILD